MKASPLLRLLGTTLLGGIVFLVPLVLLLLVLGQAVRLMSLVVAPFAAALPVQSLLGFSAPYPLAVALLLLVCLAAGLAARHGAVGRGIRSLESNYLLRIPAYAFLKTRADGLLQAEAMQDMTPVLVRFDDHWQLGFEMERVADGRVVVYVPGAPDPWSGSVHVFDSERVAPVEISVRSAGDLMLRLGRGTAAALGGEPHGPVSRRTTGDG